ncbi:phage major capsid protein [Heyndrickxia oleronia]|jgi:HK97 family phage major capsid protein|uniref:phage major capsid protein n=1 Tax=Heyndrickxia oleronia TaxID=38875 RepID=UPI00242F1E0F|nr:phage major capsid protein [Heyndrickxia oleronia]MCI1593222.1 phage major capsid protein [Heyndrickxia oleronia]MCI1615463.1 phage major capsid protein [Heyndrickxia oleronia]MCI1746187.1 phage major capsid protein [Heyndrickxia oleronia]MCI1763570.1 phage major capsid protein [Heyndrickxia oleronia]
MKTKEELLKRKSEISALLADETRSIDNLDEIEKELREINDQLAAIEKREQLMKDAAEINSGKSTETRTIETFNSNSQEQREIGTDSLEYRNAFMNYVLRGEEIPAELRANAVTKTNDVGSVIPETVLNKIIEKIESVGMILPLVTRTAIKGGVTVPTSSVKPVATWVAESSGSDKQKKTTGSITFNYHKLRCAVAVSLEVDTMALAVFESTLINNVVEAMTKAIEQAIISGSGSGQPKGILTEIPVEGQTLDVAKIEYKTLVDAESALPLEYESNAVWVMTKKTFMGFVGMTDADGQPIARINYGISGKPERTLLGRPVILCNYIDSFATADSGEAFAFLFNFSDYVLNTNYQMGVKKYEDNETDDLVTKAIMIVDGKVIDLNSLVVLKKAAAA